MPTNSAAHAAPYKVKSEDVCCQLMKLTHFLVRQAWFQSADMRLARWQRRCVQGSLSLDSDDCTVQHRFGLHCQQRALQMLHCLLPCSHACNCE